MREEATTSGRTQERRVEGGEGERKRRGRFRFGEVEGVEKKIGGGAVKTAAAAATAIPSREASEKRFCGWE